MVGCCQPLSETAVLLCDPRLSIGMTLSSQIPDLFSHTVKTKGAVTICFRLTSKICHRFRSCGDVRLCWCLSAGMQAFYEVKSCNGDSSTMQGRSVTRTYYIAVEKVLWDYAPSQKDLINHIPLTEAGRWAKVSPATHSPT